MMDRALTVESVRATELAAMAAWWKRNHNHCYDKNQLDNAAVTAMHQILSKEFPYNLEVIIGEGEWDEAPMFHCGEKLGNGEGPLIHVAVDPLDGTSNTAKGLPGATSVIAFSEGGGMLPVPDIMYLRKIVVGPAARGCISLEQSLTDNLYAIAQALDKPLHHLNVCILERERNQKFIDEARSLGCNLKLINGCDIVPGIVTAYPKKGVDVLFGSGGAPEGILLAAAIKCLNGDMCAQFVPEDSGLTADSPEMAQVPHGHLWLDDLIPGDDIIFALTGVTDNLLTKGIKYNAKTDFITTDSRAYRSKSSTRREMKAERKLSTHPVWSRYQADQGSSLFPE